MLLLELREVVHIEQVVLEQIVVIIDIDCLRLLERPRRLLFLHAAFYFIVN